MKYLCLIYGGPQAAQMTEAEMATLQQEFREFSDDIQHSGHYVASNRVMAPDSAITLRRQNGKVSTTDGPFAETREQLGGYYVIKARDLNEAIQVAGKVPRVPGGCVEVRPIREDAQTMATQGDSHAD